MDVGTTNSFAPAGNPVGRGAGLKALFVGAALVLLILMFGRSMMRNFDMDEHQFVAPAVFLTDGGYFPYHDYPYFHMPDLIYVHGVAVALAPYKLLVTRAVSVLCGWLTVLLVFRAGWKALAGHSAPTRWLLVGGMTAAYVCSQLFAYTSGWAWNHESATFCAVAAALLQLRGMKTGCIGWIACAGAMAGLAMGIRLSFAPIVVPMGIVLWIGPAPLTWRGRAAAFALAIGAALLALTPAIISWCDEPGLFMFGNLGYARLSTEFYASRAGSKYMTVGGKVYYLFRKFLSDPGNAFLFLAGIYAMGYVYWKTRLEPVRSRNELGLMAALMPALLLGVWGPTPTQQQYFFALLPFLALACLYGMALECGTPGGLKRWRRAIILGALLPAAIGLPRWYWPVVYLPSVADWTPMRVHQTGEWIKSLCPPGARVLTADPLFPAEAGMTGYPEYAVGRFVLHVGGLMTPEDRRHFRVAHAEELDRVLAERPPAAIFRHTKSPSDALTDYARGHGFHKLDYQFSYRNGTESPECFELWVRDPNSTYAQLP